MHPEESDTKRSGQQSQSVNLEKLLEERERLEELIKNRFTRKITVMFTDFKGSTSIADSEGDVFSRMLIKKHNDIIFPIIGRCNGVLVKTMGDGTLTYFENASDAVRAAVQMQREINDFNMSGKSTIPILVRIGMNTGTGIVEKNDIFGDVVNVASRFESLARPGEIYISEHTVTALGNKEEFYCRHIHTTSLKGKKDAFKVFKVFWNESEIESDKARGEYRAPGLAPPGDDSAPDNAGSLAAPGPPGKEIIAEDSVMVQKARRLREKNELLELYLYCEEFRPVRGVGDIYWDLQHDLQRNDKVETCLNGKKALWFFREAITMGRMPGADFPITNQALARVPIRVGIRNGEGVLKVESRGNSKVHTTELQRGSRTETLKPDAEYLLGREGKIVFAVCFPFEYRFYKGRFLILNILNPEECLQRQFNARLRDVWREYDSESERFLVIGV